jgi:hypothetical protein
MATHEDLAAIYPNIMTWFELTRTICIREIGLAAEHMETIVKDVEQMIGFKKREHAVKDYLKCALENIQFSNNIEQNWGGYYARQQGKMDLHQA